MPQSGTSSPSTGARPNTVVSRRAVNALESAREECPPPGHSPTSNPWHELLYDRLRDEALPALIVDEAITPAASLWMGSRLWVESFRSTSLTTGDRVVVSLPPSAAFVQVLLAALWEGLSIAVAPPSADTEGLLDHLDARATISSEPATHGWHTTSPDGPSSEPTHLRPSESPRTPDVRFLLQTSGTTGDGTWVALSDHNVLSVLASHVPHLALKNARVLSVLPWSHAFGLVLDLFPALLSGAEIVRDPKGGRSPSHLVQLGKAWGVTHLSAVPLTIKQLAEASGGPRLLKHLHGGIVGGAPIDGPLADRLSHTSLRVGYGQTEAAPGIALGAPGDWAAHYLGTPVGCSVRVASDGELLFEGPNACIGFWRNEGLERTDPGRTVHTSDLVRRESNRLFFRGRKDDAFSLSNGRIVRAGALEGTLKRAFPSLEDAFVYSPNGDDVAVALCPPDSNTDVPSIDAVRTALGSVGHRLAETTTVASDAWPTDPKGAVDRDAFADVLTAHDLSS